MLVLVLPVLLMYDGNSSNTGLPSGLLFWGYSAWWSLTFSGGIGVGVRPWSESILRNSFNRCYKMLHLPSVFVCIWVVKHQNVLMYQMYLS